MIKKIKYNFRNMDKTLFFTTLLLLFFGLINIVTASSREAVLVNNRGIYYYFFKQMVILLIGFVGYLIVVNNPSKIYYKLGPLLYFLIFGAVVYCFFMSAKRGALNWISVGGFQFQPSEFAKPIIIMCVALLFEKYGKLYHNITLQTLFSKPIGLLCIVGLLIPAMTFLQKDLGTTFITVCIVGFMFLGSPIPGKYKSKLIKYGIILVVVLLGMKFVISGHILTDAQKSRLNYLNPCSKYEQGGYQVCNAYIALNDGGLFGLGIGKSKQKYSYIPEPHTDSIFAIIGEEWGVLKCFIFVFIPYIIVLQRILAISSKASTIRGRYICLGVASYIFMHILINMGGLFGVLPLTGVPLPFLSYGGSYTLCLIVSLAMVQRVNIETKTKKIKL